MKNKKQNNNNIKNLPLLINIEPISNNGDVQDIDAEELEQMTYTLRDDLNELNTIENVDIVKTEDEIPKGAKVGGEIATWGSLLVTLATSAISSSTFLPGIVDTLQSWIKRNENRKITMKIGQDQLELTGISDKEQQKLIDAWINKNMQNKIDVNS